MDAGDAFDRDQLFAKNTSTGWKWIMIGLTGVQVASSMSSLFWEMVEATWTDLPSDYVPTPDA